MFNKLPGKRISLLLSVVLLTTGFGLYNGEASYSIVRLMNQILSSHFNEMYWAIGLGYVSTLLIYSGILCFIFFLHRSGKISQRKFCYSALFLLVVHYLFYLVKNSWNYPIYDDQGAVLEFMNQYTDAKSIQEKLKLLVAPFWESRQTVPRLFLLTIWKLFHEINFQYLVWFDAVLLISFHFLLLRKFLQKSSLRLPYVLAFSLLAFQFQAFNNIFCGLSGLCYNGVLFFAMLSFSFLEKKGNGKLFLSILFAVAAELTFGNGIWIFPLSIIYLWRQNRKHDVLVWSVLFLSILLFNFIDRKSFVVFFGMSFNAMNVLFFIPALLGSAFQFLFTMHLPVITGVFVLIIFLIAVLKKWDSSSHVIFMMLALLVVSAISAAPFRSGINPGGQYALQVRYGTFSIYAIILAIALVAENTSYREGKKYLRIVAFAFAYNLLSGLFFYPEVPIRTQKIQVMIQELKKEKYSIEYSIYKQKEFEELMKTSISKGMYQPR